MARSGSSEDGDGGRFCDSTPRPEGVRSEGSVVSERGAEPRPGPAFGCARALEGQPDIGRHGGRSAARARSGSRLTQAGTMSSPANATGSASTGNGAVPDVVG